MTGICGPVSFFLKKLVRNRHSMAYGLDGVYGIPGLDAHRLRIHFLSLGKWPKGPSLVGVVVWKRGSKSGRGLQ